MKSQKPKQALLAAFLLLVGISSTDAALCQSTVFADLVTTCDCPVGTAPSGSYASALPVGVYGKGGGDTPVAGAGAAAVASQLAAAKTALAFCVDLLPGYKKSAGDLVLPTLCAKADGYCPGMPNAFHGDAASIIVTSGGDGTYTLPVTGTFVTKTGGGVLASLQSTVPILCPANSGGANTAKIAQAAAGPSSASSSAPFTIDKCKVTDGFYVSAATAAAVATVAECPQFKVCATGTHAGSPVLTPTDCVTGAANSGGVNDVLAPGGFWCPVRTYGKLGLTLAASIAGIVGEKPCGAGSGPKIQNAVDCDVLPGFYGSDSTTGAAMTACPTGLTGNGGLTLAAACTEVAPGYEILTDIPEQITPGSITALTTGIVPCAGVNKICLGTRAVAIKGTSESLVTFAAVAKSTASTTCPTGTGNSLTGVTAQGVNAKSFGTACVDLLTGYSMIAAGADTVINNHVAVCTKLHYKCAGYAGLFVKIPGTGAQVATAIAALKKATGVEAATAGALVITSANAFVAGNVATAGTAGSLMRTTCDGNSVSDGKGALVASCLLNPGYYVDHSDLTAAMICVGEKYCPGGGPMGVAGGLLNCPAGSIPPATIPYYDDGAENYIINSNIDACTLQEGFYLAPLAVNKPVPCLAAMVCPGGGPVGTAGGSAVCPTDSTNTGCIAAGAPSTTTTVNLTPASQPITTHVAAAKVAAAAVPDVTVTNTVPSASSAASTVASMVVVTVAAMVAL